MKHTEFVQLEFVVNPPWHVLFDVLQSLSDALGPTMHYLHPSCSRKYSRVRRQTRSYHERLHINEQRIDRLYREY